MARSVTRSSPDPLTPGSPVPPASFTLAKRTADIVLALAGLIVTAPALLAAMIGIRLTSPGGVIYRAKRTGAGGRPFTMYKLRTMHVASESGGSRITAADDPRVFRFGRLLRRTKIDELPQLLNILRGDMSLVGPRPEHPAFVVHHYTPDHSEILAVRPGLTSPGTLYEYTRAEPLPVGEHTESVYLERVLPLKLELDRYYVRNRSIGYDLRLLQRTLFAVAARLAGREQFDDPPEMEHVSSTTRRSPRPGQQAILFLMLLVPAFSCTDAVPSKPIAGWVEDGGNHPILVGAGDIARCDSNADERTAALLDSIPGIIFTTGDNVYPDGAPADFTSCYVPSWGRHLARTRPVPGNHDYQTAGAVGYYRFFGARAGVPGGGFYSYDVGSWHIVALNSEIDMGESSPQVKWLRQDLLAHATRCTLAYWHVPRFSSGDTHGDSHHSAVVWDVLYRAGVDVVLNGHEHYYERFAPQTPAGTLDPIYGIRQFIVGTGGAPSHSFAHPSVNSEVRRAGVSGVLAVRLMPNMFEWWFIAAERSAFTDSGIGVCHDPPSAGPAHQRVAGRAPAVAPGSGH
jgi:lipopolysaccharide/colanic/teichoic acid biosynthesis glycosyltransferase